MAAVGVSGVKMSPLLTSDRTTNLVVEFERVYGHRPTHICRAPGRVNLIGEHIDYSGYSVLPMAVELDVLIALRCDSQGKGKVKIANVQGDRYPAAEANASADVVITPHTDNPLLNWSNYFLCGMKGILESEACTKKTIDGMEVLVDGTVPAGAGLSSSSAMVCSSALVTVIAAGQADRFTMTEIADVCTKSEKYIGVMGGGMDQAISCLAEAGTAKFVQFSPLRVESVELPKGAVFVVVNSLAESNKAMGVSPYNIRVLECRAAACLIAKANGIAWNSVTTLGGVAHALSWSLRESYDRASELSSDKMTFADVAKHLDVSERDLLIHLTSNNATLMENEAVRAMQLNPRSRAVHVYSESQRVLDFKGVCMDAVTEDKDKAKRLGALMNDSHCSCRDLYDCSSPELDLLVTVLSECGAIGARLTGAGWGGCTVSLVAESDVNTFIDKVWTKYFSNRSIEIERRSQVIFATRPASGACVMTVE